jgi:uncharacterized cupin superfamily protein
VASDVTQPRNVLRPGPGHWEQSEGLPAGFAWNSLEFRDRLGLRQLGAHLEQAAPGVRTAPLHAHLLEEEVFFVVSGVLRVRELHGDAATSYSLHAGDLVVYPPGTGIAHAFANPSANDPAVFLALSDDHWGEVCVYPDSGKTMLRPLQKVGVFGDARDAAAAAAHIAAAADLARTRAYTELPDSERPSHVVPAASVPERDLGKSFGRRLSAAGGARRVLVNRDRLPPGGRTAPLHWHSGDEELVLVLSGTPTLRQQEGVWPAPTYRGQPAPEFGTNPATSTVLAPGDVVYFGPQLPLAHQLLNESSADCDLLVVGLDAPGDLAIFPETGRVAVKLLDRGGWFTATGYWDGERAR